MTVYAKCPEGDWDYLTAGKLYPVINECSGGFRLVDNEGDDISCLWNNCPHIDGYNWERVECAVDWTKPIEWVSQSGSIEKVLEVRSAEGCYFPKIAVVGSGELHCYEDGRICIDDCGYLRNIAEPEITLVDTSPALRDQFAMAALAAAYRNDVPRDTARWVYEVADAMLEARKVNNEAA